jgi:hypothetical protein
MGRFFDEFNKTLNSRQTKSVSTPKKISKDQEEEFKNARWEEILKNPSSYDPAIIVSAMNWFNIRDEEERQKKLKLYMQERKDYFHDVEEE